jgi:hypothetical protein
MKKAKALRATALHVAGVAALAVAWAGPAVAADSAGRQADATATVQQDLSSITSLDEVVVTGKLDSLSGIRAAIKDSEERFYARYNELNKDRNFDITCRNEAPTGSRVDRDNCQAQVVDETSAAEAQAFVSGIAGTVPVTPMTVLRSSAAAEMRQRALVLLKNDPELMQDLLEHARLEQMYQQMVRKKFKGHLFGGH